MQAAFFGKGQPTLFAAHAWRTAWTLALGMALCTTGHAGAAAETISLASWNVRNISNNSRSEAELGIIALVVFRYDFVAMQEVLDETVIRRVQAILRDDFRADYDVFVSDQVGRNKKERYAFLWRTDRIRLGSPAPRLFPDPGDRLEREPLCGSFEAGNFDWTICTIHLLFGQSEADRRPELRVLDDVYRAERDAGPERDIIICGDFNFDPTDEGWDELKSEDSMSHAISPPGKTTLEDKSLFDNCWWPSASTEIRAGSGLVFEFDETMFPPGSRQEANRLTSDHRPISITIQVDMADDD